MLAALVCSRKESFQSFWPKKNSMFFFVKSIDHTRVHEVGVVVFFCTVKKKKKVALHRSFKKWLQGVSRGGLRWEEASGVEVGLKKRVDFDVRKRLQIEEKVSGNR